MMNVSDRIDFAEELFRKILGHIKNSDISIVRGLIHNHIEGMDLLEFRNDRTEDLHGSRYKHCGTCEYGIHQCKDSKRESECLPVKGKFYKWSNITVNTNQ